MRFIAKPDRGKWFSQPARQEGRQAVATVLE
jgi:hypothetical protein